MSSSRSKASTQSGQSSRRVIDAPVMADESAWNSRYDVIEIAERRAADIVSIYTTKPGGLYRAMEMAAAASRGRSGVQRQWLGRDRHRQSRQSSSRSCRGRGGHRCPVWSRCRPRQKRRSWSGRRYLLHRRSDRRAVPFQVDGCGQMCPTGPGMGIAVDEVQDREATGATIYCDGLGKGGPRCAKRSSNRLRGAMGVVDAGSTRWSSFLRRKTIAYVDRLRRTVARR